MFGSGKVKDSRRDGGSIIESGKPRVNVTADRSFVVSFEDSRPLGPHCHREPERKGAIQCLLEERVRPKPQEDRYSPAVKFLFLWPDDRRKNTPIRVFEYASATSGNSPLIEKTRGDLLRKLVDAPVHLPDSRSLFALPAREKTSKIRAAGTPESKTIEFHIGLTLENFRHHSGSQRGSLDRSGSPEAR